MKYDMITIGGATEDITFYTKEGVLIDNKKDLARQKLLAFEFGAKIKVDESFSGFGGGAANTAVCFSRLGFKSACLTTIGRDSRGQRIIDNLTQQGVDVTLVQKAENSETGFSFLLAGPEGEHLCFSNRAANDELRITTDELRILQQAKWLYLASLSGQWQAELDKAFALAGPKIAWNPGREQVLAGAGVLEKYIKRTACLIVNKDEAIEIVMSDKKYKNKGANFFNNIKNLLPVLSSYGSEMVVITSGVFGADVLAQGKAYHQPIVKAPKSVDTTGVGDAFGSSFIAGLELYQQDIGKALELAARNSSAKVSQRGAQNGLMKKKDL